MVSNCVEQVVYHYKHRRQLTLQLITYAKNELLILCFYISEKEEKAQ